MPSLAEVAEINPRVDREQVRDLTELASFVPMANVSEASGAITAEESRQIGELLKGFTPFLDRDVLVAKITPCFENGKIAHARISKRQGFGSTEFHVIRPVPQWLDDRYLFHFLRQPRIRIEGERRMTGSAGQRRVPKAYLASLEIPIPSLAEQRRIAAILDKADGLRAKRTEAIAKLDQLLQSVFLDMFGNPVTNPAGWPTRTVESLATFVTSGSRGWAKYYADKGAKFVRIQNLVDGDLDLSDCAYVQAPDSAEARRTLVREGDVLLSITADLGRTAVVPAGIGAAHINQHIAILRLSGINPSYVSHFLAGLGGRIQFDRLNRAAVKAGLNFDDIRALEILVPPNELQDQYLSRLEAIKGLKRRLEAQQGRFDSMFSSLQQRAFPGAI